MTLDQLRMLTKIAEEGSVFAAAEALHRAQPTVSVAMKKLEKELGVSLISREQYRAALTEEGKVLYEKAKTILQHVGTFEGLAEHLAVGNEPEMRIAIEASCPVPLMLKIMRICNERFAQTRFSFSMETIRGAIERLLLDEADLAITPFYETEPSLESFHLISTELIRVAAPGFLLSSASGVIEFEELKEYVQVIVNDSSHNPPDELHNVLDGGRHWFVNDHYTKRELLLAGMGWGMLHRHLVAKELDEGSLIALDVANRPLVRKLDIGVSRKAVRAWGPIATDLWERLQALAAANEEV